MTVVPVRRLRNNHVFVSIKNKIHFVKNNNTC